VEEKGRREAGAATSVVMLHLPPHPAWKGRDSSDARVVLPSFAAPIVTEVLELPEDADPSRVYVGEAFAQGGGNTPFVRAVWFAPETCDEIIGQRRGSHARATRHLKEVWQATAPMGHHKGVAEGGATQPAGGLYTELGFGVLAGKGRASVGSAGKRSIVPYVRNPAMTQALEAPLSEFMSNVSDVLHGALPQRVLQAQGSVQSSCPERVREAYQYPRLRKGSGHLHSHQVVMRSPAHGATQDEDDMLAMRAISDLHIDPWDGGGNLGSCTVHTCSTVQDQASPGENGSREAHLLLHRGIVVFPEREGGRGVHIRSMVPGWQCALIFCTHSCLHGSVMLDEQDAQGFSLPHLEMFRVVTYPLRRIEVMLARVSESAQMWDAIARESDEWTRRRIMTTEGN
jgi:hypothetical protein